MALVSVNLTEQNGSNATDGARRVEVYRVIFDAIPTDIPGDVIGAVGIPEIGDNYTGSSTITCKNVGNIQKTDSRLVYLVTASFDNLITGSSSTTTNPLSRPADINWGFRVVSQAIEKDQAGNKLDNSAGDMFVPGIEINRYRLICNISRNVNSHSPSDALAKIDHVNNASLTVAGITVAAGQALLTEYSGTAVYEGDSDYIRQNFQLEFAPTHDIEIADMGYEYLDATDSKRKKFTDGEGTVINIPKFLTSAGDDGGETARYLTFTVYDTANLGALGLPTAFPDT